MNWSQRQSKFQTLWRAWNSWKIFGWDRQVNCKALKYHSSYIYCHYRTDCGGMSLPQNCTLPNRDLCVFAHLSWCRVNFESGRDRKGRLFFNTNKNFPAIGCRYIYYEIWLYDSVDEWLLYRHSYGMTQVQILNFCFLMLCSNHPHPIEKNRTNKQSNKAHIVN